jgi:hypothetical protein
MIRVDWSLFHFSCTTKIYLQEKAVSKKIIWPAAAIAAALFISAYSRQTAQQDPFFSRLQGAWKGEGNAFGAKAQAVAKWEWMLGDKFFRLTLRYETLGKDGKKQVFEGHGYYQPKGGGKYEGRWFDSQGNTYPIQAQLEGETLVALWGTGAYQGRSAYHLNEAGKQLELTDAIKQKDGSWKEFSRLNLQRE